MCQAAVLWPNSAWVTRKIDAEQSRPRTPLTARALTDLGSLASIVCFLRAVPQHADADTSNVPRMACAGCGLSLLPLALGASV